MNQTKRDDGEAMALLLQAAEHDAREAMRLAESADTAALGHVARAFVYTAMALTQALDSLQRTKAVTP